MRIFIVPSWCPTPREPLSGTFFVEQAHALARARQDWSIGFARFDLSQSRVPWRPTEMPDFFRNLVRTSRIRARRAASGLYEYEVWQPYVPAIRKRQRWDVAVNALFRQLCMGLERYTADLGAPDLIHAHAVYPGGAAATLLGARVDVPVVLSEHLGPFPPPTLLQTDGKPLPLVIDAYKKSVSHSAVSLALAKRIETLGLSKRVTVIPNFLEDAFGAEVIRCPKRRGARFTILAVGAPSHAKGTDLLLSAVARLDKTAVLQVIGTGAESAIYQRMAHELGIADRVQWLGPVERSKMPAHYADSDVVVLASRGETFGICLIEALACGKPIVATCCGGPEDIVDGHNGQLVPNNDADALASALADVQAGRMRYEPLAQRQDFLNRFSTSAVTTQIEKWYHEAITKPAVEFA